MDVVGSRVPVEFQLHGLIGRGQRVLAVPAERPAQDDEARGGTARGWRARPRRRARVAGAGAPLGVSLASADEPGPPPPRIVGLGVAGPVPPQAAMSSANTPIPTIALEPMSLLMSSTIPRTDTGKPAIRRWGVARPAGLEPTTFRSAT